MNRCSREEGVHRYSTNIMVTLVYSTCAPFSEQATNGKRYIHTMCRHTYNVCSCSILNLNHATETGGDGRDGEAWGRG